MVRMAFFNPRRPQPHASLVAVLFTQPVTGKAEQKQMLAATFTVQIGALMYAAILFYMDVLRLGLGPQDPWLQPRFGSCG